MCCLATVQWLWCDYVRNSNYGLVPTTEWQPCWYLLNSTIMTYILLRCNTFCKNAPFTHQMRGSNQIKCKCYKQLCEIVFKLFVSCITWYIMQLINCCTGFQFSSTLRLNLLHRGRMGAPVRFRCGLVHGIQSLPSGSNSSGRCGKQRVLFYCAPFVGVEWGRICTGNPQCTAGHRVRIAFNS